MAEYFVLVKDYFNGRDCESNPGHLTANMQRCQEPMQGLASRYGLDGKTIFSIGAGDAIEEYWWLERGNILTLNDVNESFKRFITSLPQYEMPATPDVIRWIIQDIGQWVLDNPQPEFDLLYISSLHPDEIRREDIQNKFIKTRTDDEAYNYITWPKGEPPYHDLVVNSFKKVRKGGLIILQHYRGGVYVKENPQYLKDVQKQFSDCGVQLLEVYCYRESTVHLLLAAYKGSRKDALKYQQTLAVRPPIESFHGRYPYAEIRNDIVKVFEFGNPEIVTSFE